MSAKIALTLACGDYEIIRPLKEGTVTADGIDLTILTAMDSTTRHWRFLRNREFDVAEVSACSYMTAIDQELPFRAIPVFLHRRFRHGAIYVNTSKGIRKPADLAGRKVGVKAYQATATLWMRGILEHEYGVPHRSVQWFSELEEHVDFTPPPDLKLTKVADEKAVDRMLEDGEIDALLHPDLIRAIVKKDPRVARLFPDYRAEQIAYFKKTGIFPIMHVTGLRREIAEKHPWVAINLQQAFNNAKALAMKRMENPRMVPLALWREAWEEQEEIFGSDPWEYGLTDSNRNNIETLAQYVHEQGLTRRRLRWDDLFLNVSPGKKRGEVFRF
jgi:4,5-dihydroxyphthalate decarboxylase